jgi:hypothetical protein
MSHALEAFEIELPPGVDKAALASLQQALAETGGVDQCGQSTARSLDPAALTLWVTLAGSVLTTLGAAVPVVRQIIDLCKRKGIKGAKLVLADGSVLQADEISSDDLLKLSQRP